MHLYNANPFGLLTQIAMSYFQGCESVCEKKSEKIWNNLRAWKDVLFTAFKVWKWGFVKSKKSLKSDYNLNSHIPVIYRLFVSSRYVNG